MCLVDRRDTFLLPVLPWSLEMRATGLWHFDFYAPYIRHNLSLWLGSLKGGIPLAVYSALMFSEWGFFFSEEGGLQVESFMLVLFFFDTNGASNSLRRLFWTWLLPVPSLDGRGVIDRSHPYVGMYYRVLDLDFLSIARRGGFFDVRGGGKGCGSVWGVYNIWNCRGLSMGGFNQLRRVDTTLVLVNEDHDPLSWSDFLSPETFCVDGSFDSDNVGSEVGTVGTWSSSDSGSE